MLDDVEEVDRVALTPEHDPVTAADPRPEVVLVGEDGLDVEARSVGALDQCHDSPITGDLPVGRQPRVAVPPLLGPRR